MKYEFCITDGPGTLIDYGTATSSGIWHAVKSVILDGVGDDAKFIAEPCSDDCETGE